MAERGKIAAGPASEAERILALDVLRGVAVLGILAMNIQDFSQIGAAYMNPTATGPLTGSNYWVWLATHVFADEKFMSIFSMLYGAGMVLFTARIEARGARPFPVFLRRSLWLLVFGLLHAYLIWSGDILVSYAICGLAVYRLRKLDPQRLIIAGLIVVGIGSALSLANGWSIRYWPAETVNGLREGIWQPSAAKAAAEIAAYRGGWLAQMPWRAADSLMGETQGLLFLTLWRAGGLMLVGMGLYKCGMITGSLPVRTYRNLGLGGLLFGLPLIALGVHYNFQAQWDLHYSFFTGSQFNYWGSLGIALAWICLVMIACKIQGIRRAVKTFANMGRMAFSNYILETLICTTIFYGHGFGMFAKVDRLRGQAIVLAVWAAVFVFSQLWMRRFYFGPLEWLWRSLTYGEREPFRRGPVRKVLAAA